MMPDQFGVERQRLDGQQFALGRFAYKRLVVDNKPPEKKIETIKEED